MSYDAEAEARALHGCTMSDGELWCVESAVCNPDCRDRYARKLDAIRRAHEAGRVAGLREAAALCDVERATTLALCDAGPAPGEPAADQRFLARLLEAHAMGAGACADAIEAREKGGADE